MVKIAIAGGSGEIIDALVATGKHDIALLSRKDGSNRDPLPRTRWVQVDYGDKAQLTTALQGTDTVLSFITPQTDPENGAQRNLIDASIAAGVRRFAPSEWATSSVEYMDWYAGKQQIRDYLKSVNDDKKILEYSLFQPGLFLNYFSHPHKTAKHVNTFQTQFDFENRRAIIPDGCDDVKISTITAQDLASVVARAIEYNGEWPTVGGVKGCDVSIAQLIELGEKVRGGQFSVERLNVDDLKKGIVHSTWMPVVSHPAITAEQANALSKDLLAGMTLGISVGALAVSDEWNRLFPDHRFTQPYPFLSEAWDGKA